MRGRGHKSIAQGYLQGLVAPFGQLLHRGCPLVSVGEIAAAVPAGAEIILEWGADLNFRDSQQIADGRRAFVSWLRDLGVDF